MRVADDLTREFLVESHENLNQLDTDFVALERNPDDSALLQNIFRYIHTIKGTAGCLGYPKLEHVTHAGENLLARMRDGEIRLNQEITTSLLNMVDAVRRVLHHIEESGVEGDEDYSDLVSRIERLNKTATEAGAIDAAVEECGSPEALEEPPTPNNAAAGTQSEDTAMPPKGSGVIETGSGDSSCDSAVPTPHLGELLVAAEIATAEQVQEALSVQSNGDPRHVGEILIDHANIQPELVRDALAVQRESSLRGGGSVADSTIRVDARLLDKLMNLVGELVLTRNQIIQHLNGVDDSGLSAASQQLDLLTSELQEGVMKTRMQPIGSLWGKLSRVVRDVASGCNKKVTLETEGEDTELDKTILEAIKDPLTHIIRNAIDHGVELPADRLKAGKPEEGRIALSAYHEGGQVNIVISDDGAGLNAARIREKAIERGLIARDDAAAMSERELISLIFLPGFSTASAVTNLSGRGVGMDVVKTHVEKIGGSVEVHSEFGTGTTLRIRIPLTLAIIPALVVGCRKGRYAIPQVNVLELVRLEKEQAHQAIEQIHGTPVYRLRGQLLPLVYFDRILHPKDESAGLPHDKTVFIVVLQADQRVFGLVVDSIVDTQEIVVKPLSKHFKNLNVFAGATIMGDGDIAMILDTAGIAELSGVKSAGERKWLHENTASGSSERRTLLLVRQGETQRLAFPLERVARLEEVKLSAIERVGQRSVLQYRGEIMPIVPLSLILDGGGAVPTVGNGHAERPAHVVVCRNGKGFVGVLVEEILDIVDENVSTKGSATRPGVECTAVVQGTVSEILDLESLLTTGVYS